MEGAFGWALEPMAPPAANTGTNLRRVIGYSLMPSARALRTSYTVNKVSRTLFLMLVCAATGARASGPTAAELARSIHDAALDPDECYRVRDLRFRKDDVRLYLTD